MNRYWLLAVLCAGVAWGDEAYVVMFSSRPLFMNKYGDKFAHYSVANPTEKEFVENFSSKVIAEDMAEALNAAHERRIERSTGGK